MCFPAGDKQKISHSVHLSAETKVEWTATVLTNHLFTHTAHFHTAAVHLGAV